MRTFASTHTILSAPGGEFVSLLDPAPDYEAEANKCKNIGCWPVLVGEEKKNDRDTMLSSPIILYDYPKIAAESAGDLFDGTEIDEILTLRVKTMTDAEKAEMRNVDDQARRILERTENITATISCRCTAQCGIRARQMKIFLIRPNRFRAQRSRVSISRQATACEFDPKNARTPWTSLLRARPQ